MCPFAIFCKLELFKKLGLQKGALP